MAVQGTAGWGSGGGSLTPAVARWYRESLEVYLVGEVESRCKADGAAAWRPAAEDLPAYVEWYAGRAGEFVYWAPYGQFDGDHLDTGAWKIDWRRVADRIFACEQEVRVARNSADEAAAYPTLDAWLDAHARGKLTGPAPRETAWYQYAIKFDQATLRWTARERRRRWPVLCQACGHEFLPNASGTRRRCDACIASAKARPASRKRARKASTDRGA